MSESKSFPKVVFVKTDYFFYGKKLLFIGAISCLHNVSRKFIHACASVY